MENKTRLRRLRARPQRHRRIMEQIVGRQLRTDEHVHHINKNPSDNRRENLLLMSAADHIALHAKEKQVYPDTRNCAVCGKLFRVNRKHRKRNSCCSPECGSARRTSGRCAQVSALRRSGAPWPTVQQRNLFSMNGETLGLLDWARRTGIKYQTLYRRIHSFGWSVTRSLTTPARKHTRSHE
jgi:HNH endonuclease